MKLKKEFLVHNTEKEAILVPSGAAEFSGVVRGNKPLGAILDMLKTDTTEEAIIANLKTVFDAPEGAVEKDVRKVLAELEAIGALEQ